MTVHIPPAECQQGYPSAEPLELAAVRAEVINDAAALSQQVWQVLVHQHLTTGVRP